MPTDHSQWLPPKAANDGPRDVPYWALMAVALLCTVRSLIHMLATDGGAHSIAGIAVSGVAGSSVGPTLYTGASVLKPYSHTNVQYPEGCT
jgi:hypothetical protein